MFAILTGLAFALYFTSAFCSGASLFLNAPQAPAAPSLSAGGGRTARLGRPLLLTGIVVQFLAIGAWCVSRHLSPFASETGTLSVLAWAIAVAYALFDLRSKMPAVGAIALLVACLALCWGIVESREPLAETPLLKSQVTSLHVLAIVASFGLFAVAFGCAALYLIQTRVLKGHNSHGLFRRLPPLANLDRAAYLSVAYALPMLTLGLAIGVEQAYFGALNRPFHSWLADPRIILSLVTWLLYVLYLLARLAAGWRGVRLQYILLIGMAITLALYVVPTSSHRFN